VESVVVLIDKVGNICWIWCLDHQILWTGLKLRHWNTIRWKVEFKTELNVKSMVSCINEQWLSRKYCIDWIFCYILSLTES